MFNTYNGITNLSVNDAVDSWKANQSNLVAGQSMSSNDKSREVINNLSEGKSQQDIENALNSGFAKYDENGNATNTVSLYNDVNDNNKGTHQHSTGNNYINSAYTDMTNTSDVLKVASHENAHNYTKNEDLANASQKYTAFSYFMGNVASGDSVNKNGTATNTSWNNTYGNTQQMNYNTSVVRSIRPDDRSNLPYDELLIDSKDSGGRGDYGPREKHPITKKPAFHHGVDTYTNSDDKSVHAAADGTVIYTEPQVDKTTGELKGWGNQVVILHDPDENGDVYATRYAHLKEKPNIEPGTKVQEGQPIAIMGNTGGSAGAHLHYEILKQDPTNPKADKNGWVHVNPQLPENNVGNYNRLWETPYQDNKREYKNIMEQLNSPRVIMPSVIINRH